MLWVSGTVVHKQQNVSTSYTSGGIHNHKNCVKMVVIIHAFFFIFFIFLVFHIFKMTWLH